MIFQTIKNGIIEEKEFPIFGALTGNRYDKVVLTWKEVDELYKLQPEELKEYMGHLATRATMVQDD